jgi:hypothetical protein
VAIKELATVVREEKVAAVTMEEVLSTVVRKEAAAASLATEEVFAGVLVEVDKMAKVDSGIVREMVVARTPVASKMAIGVKVRRRRRRCYPQACNLGM